MTLTTRMEGPSPAHEVALDMVRRGALVAPVLIVIGAVAWGSDGAASVGYALGLVLVNLWLSAAIIAGTARISLALLMMGAMFGFLIRLGLIFVAVWVVRDAGWVDFVALGLTLIIAHLGLLVWELRYVSASLAYPGLKPSRQRSDHPDKETVQP